MKQIYAGVLLLCLLLSFSGCQKQEEAVLTSGEVSQEELDRAFDARFPYKEKMKLPGQLV